MSFVEFEHVKKTYKMGEVEIEDVTIAKLDNAITGLEDSYTTK